jgi:hypothetical protein
MRIGKLQIRDGPARPQYRVAAGVLALMASVPAILTGIALYRTPNRHELLLLVGWAWLPLWFLWIACTGFMFPELRRRRGTPAEPVEDRPPAR